MGFRWHLVDPLASQIAALRSVAIRAISPPQ